MSFFFEKPAAAPTDSFAGGEASLAEIAGASWTALRYAHNTGAREAALEEAYDRRIRDIHGATGVLLDNPVRTRSTRVADPSGGYRLVPGVYQEARDAFHERLGALATQFPDARDAIRPGETVEAAAITLGRDAADTAGQLAGSRDGAAKWGALLAGGAIGSLEDPVNVLSMAVPIGAGSAAATAGARVLSIATKTALVSGATEAAMQPTVQSWHKELDLPTGLTEALKNVGFAATIGGVLGGIVGGAGEVIRRATARRTDAALSQARADGTLPPQIAAAIDGDTAAGARLLEPIRSALPAEARGALDAAQALRAVDEARVPGVSPQAHRLAFERAARFAAHEEIAPLPVDGAQIERIVKQLVPEAAPVETADTLPSFLMRMGGLRDEKGEVSAVSGGQVSERFVGKLIRQDGLPLDRAREVAAEAGYLDHLFGSPEAAVARSTPADLLNAIDDALRDRAVSRISPEAERANVETMAADVAGHLGPGVSDDLILRALRVMQEEDVPAFDAAERVLVQEVQNEFGTGTSIRVTADGEGVPAFPGWSDDELEAAMRPRGLEPQPEGIDDPAVFADDLMIRREDIADIENFNFIDDEGRSIAFGRLIDDLDAEDWSARVVEACRA